MKRLASLAASLLMIVSTGLALAQVTTPVAGGPTPGEAVRIRNPKIKIIIDRIRLQEDRIAMGVKNLKLTADEAAALRAKLVAVRNEIQSDFRANHESGQKGLTDDQLKQINTELDANSAAIHDDKQGADASAGTPTK